jgi:hypothetical protein
MSHYGTVVRRHYCIIKLDSVVNVYCLALNSSRVCVCVRERECVRSCRPIMGGRKPADLSKTLISIPIPPVGCTSSNDVLSVVTFCTSLFTRAAPLSSNISVLPFRVHLRCVSLVFQSKSLWQFYGWSLPLISCSEGRQWDCDALLCLNRNWKGYE